MKRLLLILCASMVVFAACRKDNDKPIDENGNGNGITACNDSLIPLVFVHGFLASGDTYANHVMRFSSNNYCEDRMFAFDWNTTAQGADNVGALEAFIDDVLEKTNSTQVNLAGHSAGGSLSYNYLSDPVRAEKVAYYVHIGSSVQSGPAGSNGEVPTLNIWSPDDKIVQGGDIPDAENIQLPGKDHYEVATAAEAFEAMFKFFNDGATPATLEIVPQTEIHVGGRVVTLGENEARANATIHIYAVNEADGSRKNSTPDFSITSGTTGHWGPVSLTSGQTYEFEINTGITGDRIVTYYREAFTRSNPLVYLRTLPSPGSLLSFVTGGLPNDDAQSVIIVFASSQGVVAGRDNLKVDGYELSTSDFADESNNTIALFLYDGNNNKQTDLVSQGIFGTFPFLSGVDIYFQTETSQGIECELNGRKLFVRNKKSETEGVVIAVFD